MSSIYIVKVGESIRDVVANSTGNMANWDIILQANDFTDWTPDLLAGQQIIIPDNAVLDTNTIRKLQSYPLSNSTIAGYLALLLVVWDILTNRWILRNGVWDDDGIWIDTAFWKDNP